MQCGTQIELSGVVQLANKSFVDRTISTLHQVQHANVLIVFGATVLILVYGGRPTVS